MGATITLSEEDLGFDEVQRRLHHPEAVLLGPVADGVHKVFAEIFDSSGAYAGEPWEPLSVNTIEKKTRAGFSPLTLVETGFMLESLVQRNARGGYTEMRDAMTMAVGTNDDTAALHQGGTRNMPARPIAPDADRIPQQDVDAWAELIANYLLDGSL